MRACELPRIYGTKLRIYSQLRYLAEFYQGNRFAQKLRGIGVCEKGLFEGSRAY
jgi:hypothetical protein